MWRLVAAGVTRPARSAPPASEAGADTLAMTRFFDAVAGAMVDAPMIDPDRMAVGQTIDGPALLVATDTTVVLPSKACATMTEQGCLAIDRDD